MSIFTTTSVMSDGSGSRKKKTTNPAQPKAQTTAVSTAQKPADYRQQSNVQTPDLVYAKSQPTWQNNLERVQQKAEVRKDAWALAEKKQTQNTWNDPQTYIPNFSANERPFAKPVSYAQEETALKTKAAAAGMKYDSVMRDAYRAVNKANTEQRNQTMAEVAEYSPMLGSALSVLMMPSDVIGAAQVGAGALFGRSTDPNDPALQGTNARKAMQDAVAGKIAAEQGEQAAERYRDAMGVAEFAYGAYLAAGGLSGAVDIGSSAATQYINLINSGVSPEAAGKIVGVRAVLDAVGETGVFDDAVGAAVKKTGLMDTLVELGRKIPSAKKVIDEVEERLDTGMFKTGMELNDLNLTRAQEKDWIELNEHLYGFTDEELGKLAKLVEEGQSNLTITPWGDIIGETFGDDPRMFKTDLEYLPTSGVKLQATPGKTTTVLGRFTEDTGRILNELGNVKSTDLSGRAGGFNLLNTPDELYSELGGDRFWEMYNKPWLDQAIARDDIISLATLPNLEACAFYDSKLGKTVLTGFGKEYQYLLEHGYVYNQATQQMVKGGG